jgi:hypothetical protein
MFFTDESRFCLRHIDGRVRALRRPGARYLDGTLEKRFHLEEGP